MNNEKQLAATFTAFATSKNIDRPTVIRTLHDVLNTMIEKKFGSSENFDIVINPEKGDLQIFHNQEIVADDSDEAYDDDKITLSEARKIQPDFEIGENASQELNLTSFGRRAIGHAVELLKGKVQEIEREGLYHRYKEYEGELIYAEVYHLTPKVAILYDTEKNELFLPKENQIPNERYKKGSYIHAIIEEVKIHHNKLKVILSRTSPRFLAKTLENQIDEITEGIVKIRKVVRRPGQRAKVVVSTEDDRVDAVGACVGGGGQRIRNISRRELWNEQVDIIGYTDNEDLFIKRALSPAQVHNIQRTGDRIAVYLKPDQVPLAIGTNGQNIDLASQLIGQPIDVYRELTPGQEISIRELLPKVGQEVVDKLMAMGLQTVDSVIQTPKEALQERAALLREEVDDLYNFIVNKYAINPQTQTPEA